MAALIGSLVGLVLGAALLGAFVAWILRKLTAIGFLPSYAVGVSISTALYLLLGDGLSARLGSTLAGVALGALCGLAAFALLCLTSRRARRQL